MKKYAWAQNSAKLQRALGELGPDASEEVIKARYIEMAGFVLADNGNPVADEDVIQSEEEAPKKSKKK